MTPELTIDLCAIARNWQTVAAMAPAAETGAVVKANAYGLGAGPVAQALHDVGCRSFFTATFDEAADVVQVLRVHGANDCRIFLLNGIGADNFTDLDAYPEIIASVCSLPQAQRLAAARPGQRASVQVESGMHRTGLLLADMEAAQPALDQLDLQLVLSHLACADEPDHPLNAAQLASFAQTRRRFAAVPASFANSAGVMLGADYQFDLTRPGIALYGGNPRCAPDHASPFEPVVSLTAPLVQVKPLSKGQSVGYAASWVAAQPSVIGTVAAGYADGLHRAFGNGKTQVMINGHKVPVIGRISMDLITLDLTSHPQASSLAEGQPVSLLGMARGNRIDDLAQAGGTISYEILTSLGNRYKRKYLW